MAVEQSLLARNPQDSALLISSSFKLPSDPQIQRYALRVALLHILSSLQSQTLEPAKVSELIASYEKAFGGSKGPFASDFDACHLAEKFVSLEKAPLSQALLDSFASSKMSYPDICARIVLDACARAYFSEACPEMNFDRFFAVMEERLSGCLASSELWERILVFKLARASTPAEMLETADLALSDPRLCALPAYSRLVILRAALQVATQAATPAAAASYANLFLQGSPLLSPSESRFDVIQKPDAAGKLVSSLLSTGEGKEAFWLGVSSALLNPDNAAHSSSIQKSVSSSQDLTWEERCFLKMMQYR